MQPKSLAIGVFTSSTAGYYFGAMLAGIHQVARAAGVPLLIIQDELQHLQLPPYGAEHVAGWIVLHPTEADTPKLAALVATGVALVAVANPPVGIACSSVIADNRGDTQALVEHLIDHGHRRIACIDHGTDRWNLERHQGYADALHARGIAIDQTLIVDAKQISDTSGAGTQSFLWRHGEVAARQLIARGMPCTAVISGTDRSALALMHVLQAAGYRIPEDIAVVGFDDIADAQYAQPPLTTARTCFDALGRVAAEHLLAMLRTEQDVYPTRILVPSPMLRRRSCGCAGLAEIRSWGADAVAAAASWQTDLAEQLVTLVSYPLAPEPGTPPEQVWPGVETLVAAVDAVLQGQDSAAFDAGIEAAWHQAVTITENQELLNAALTLLEDVAEQRLATATAPTRPALTTLFRQLRMELLRARLGYEAAKNLSLTTSSATNQLISLNLLSSQAGESETLAWLRQTPATWGCLGLRAGGRPDDPETLTVAGVYQQQSAPEITIGSRHHAAAFPPFAALPLPAQQGHDLTILFPLRSGADDLGALVLCGFADEQLTLDVDTRLTLATLLSATLKRDVQALELAQARDAAEAANRAKSTFLASMSHELRTPLNGILGYAQILKREQLDAVAARGLSIIEQSGQHLLTLINDILDLAKIEAGRLQLNPAALQLPSFLEGIIAIIRGRAEAKQLRLSFEAPPNLPAWVQVDETRLRQVLLNLLGNAVKFTDRGSVTLRVSAEARPLSADQMEPATQPFCALRFEVVDSGIGIPPDRLERIFQPFEQAGEQWRQAEGSGLGLAISRQLVRLMGDDLHVASELGHGSTFWFQLVLPVEQAAPLAGPSHESMITGYRGRQRTVLIVDDILSNRAMLVDMLLPMGFMVLEAEHGRQALETVQQARPDLILMDRRMPILSGPEAVRQIRTLSDGARVPIVATSASVTDTDQILSQEAGYDAFLPKPIALPQLVAMLERYLQLEWEYAPAVVTAEEPEVLSLPPPEELASLLALAELGDILALQARTAQIQQRDPSLRPFVSKLERLAARFEVEQVEVILREHLARV
jgi:signal transduction histidine kinase/DNA-binding LacI/PurR family transcriptional regulator/DNA-binding NarL/FixJ family response regulator